jgi:hypothetical protein
VPNSWLPAAGLALSVLACAPLATAGPGCAQTGAPIVLDRELGETSGVAVGRRDPRVLWTHNDGRSDLFALDHEGRILARFEVSARLGDWEDIEIASCASGSCLYLADTGDNRRRRPAGGVRILRAIEPELPAGPAARDVQPLAVDVFPVRLPEGPRDVEALFVLPGEVPYLVTKGGDGAISVYRYPPPLRPDTVTLQEVQRLTERSVSLLDRVTGAVASPDGSRVAVRTYQALRFYAVEGDSLLAMHDGLVNLRTLQEIQGEGVAIGPDALIVLTSEGGPLGGPPSMRMLRCSLEEEELSRTP